MTECYTQFVFTANNLEPYFEKLSEKSWVILPVEMSLASELLESAQTKQIGFRPATTSRLTEPEPGLRSDRILWLDEQTAELGSSDRKALGALKKLRSELRDYFRVSLENLECHYSAYEPGQFYVRHHDTTQQHNQRVFSFVIYLNFDWQEADGGHLVGYGADETVLFDVRPEAGQMILFKSEIEHEVQVAHRTRYALTGWIRK